MGITELVMSKGYKNFMAKLYGLGAAVVILGALFKIMHFTGAGFMLCAGMGTEALIFALSAFEPLHVEYNWALVYPELAIENDTHGHGHGKKLTGTVTQQLDRMLEDAKVGPELIESLAAGMTNLSVNANKLSGISDAAATTDDYVANLSKASEAVHNLTSAYNCTADALNKDVNCSEIYLKNVEKAAEAVSNLTGVYEETSKVLKHDTNNYNEQLSSLNKNLSAINAVYELQLQQSTETINAVKGIEENISKYMGSLEETAENTKKYQEMVDQLARNVGALNTVYGNMLAAMNINRG